MSSRDHGGVCIQMMHPYQNSVILSTFFGVKKSAKVYWNEYLKTYIVVYETNGETTSTEFFHRQVAEDSAEDYCMM
jgi:hypothetical protein